MPIKLILFLTLSLPAAAPAAGAGPSYFTAVQNGAYNFKGGAAAMEESYKALRGMVKLADERGVRLTLLFSAQYADYIATDTARLAELEAWKNSGHEIGAYHQGPETTAWDGYTDLRGEELARAGGNAAAPLGGHAEYNAALARLQPAIKTRCMAGGADKKFLAAAPPNEICGPARGSAASGVNGAVRAAAGGAGKVLSSFHPSDKAGIEAAEKAFSGMDRGVYGAVFRSSPAEFGAYYAWLSFLAGRDPQGLHSRTVTTALAEDLRPGKNALPAPRPARTEKRKAEARRRESPPPVAPRPEKAVTEIPRAIPRLKPVPSFFGTPGQRVPARHQEVGGGYCGDGICDVFERAVPGLCPRDCGK